MQARMAIVIGGGGGIGSEICRHMAAIGIKLVVGDINEAQARSVANDLPGDGHRALPIDVTDWDAAGNFFAEVERTVPSAILVVASGGTFVDPANIANVAWTEPENWDRTIALNLTGVFNCVSHFARHRLANPLPHTRIVLFSSGSGQIGGTPTGIAYSAAKAGMIGLTRHAAIELAPAQITVNAVAPGAVGTPEFFRATSAKARAALSAMTPLGRVATPAEIAAGVAYLASEEAAFIT